MKTTPNQGAINTEWYEDIYLIGWIENIMYFLGNVVMITMIHVIQCAVVEVIYKWYIQLQTIDVTVNISGAVM